jgi:hypothetical protein
MLISSGEWRGLDFAFDARSTDKATASSLIKILSNTGFGLRLLIVITELAIKLPSYLLTA